jgi:glycosyltransferase involved in cell wall biosynthesis
VKSVSIYFPAGDFIEAIRRYDEGREQSYQTHNEVARLIYDLRAENLRVNIYSFVTPERRDDRAANGARIVSLGAKDFSTRNILNSAVAEDKADAIVAHFPNPELLRAAAATKSRVIVVMANSFNRTGIRAALGKWKVASLLNNPRFELVSNHCLPSTEHLARIGVKRKKLIAWDVAHPFDPKSHEAKQHPARRRFEVVYAGSITEAKGVAELVRAVALLREQGIEMHCSLAGLGEVDAMRALGATLGISDLLSFVGVIGNTEVFKMMSAGDLVVVPSRTQFPEGFPLALFEAIASRTPIVCSNHPMFRDVMRDGRNASVFSAGDHRSLAAAMRRTLTDPLLYANLSTNALLTWAALKGPADWRTMIFKWTVEGRSSPWILERMLTAMKPTAAHDQAPQ